MSVEVKEETLGNNYTYIFISTDFRVILEFLILRPEFFYGCVLVEDGMTRVFVDNCVK